MNELQIIRRIAQGMHGVHAAPNCVFDADAEFVTIGEQVWGLTLDSFSPEEDLFTMEAPARLGANLATATLSDLLAAGVAPAVYLHALSLPYDVAPDFVDGLTEGVRRVLAEAGCAFHGGDLGTAETWRYTGFAMGPVASARPLTRVLPAVCQTLWTTGTLGDANLAALTGTPTPAFELRLPEALLIRSHATGCIDTSGGFLDAVWTLHERNPGLRFEIDVAAVPLASGLLQALPPDVPSVAALLGGAGEYELLFATPSELSSATRDALCASGATPVGRIAPAALPTSNGAAGLYLLRSGGAPLRVESAPPSPRAAPSIAEHVRDVLAAAQRLDAT